MLVLMFSRRGLNLLKWHLGLKKNSLFRRRPATCVLLALTESSIVVEEKGKEVFCLWRYAAQFAKTRPWRGLNTSANAPFFFFLVEAITP